VANAVAGVLVTATARSFKGRMGTIGPNGFVTWKDDEHRTHSRIRFERITEKEALKEKGL
jgi:hypothetical protein